MNTDTKEMSAPRRTKMEPTVKPLVPRATSNGITPSTNGAPLKVTIKKRRMLTKKSAVTPNATRNITIPTNNGSIDPSNEKIRNLAPKN